MIINEKASKIIARHQRLITWKSARVVADLVAAGMDKNEAVALMKASAPPRKPHKPHKPHNSHAKPVNLEDLSLHYIVVCDYELLGLKHQDALIAAVRSANGKSSLHDGAMAIKLFGLVKAYPIITTAEVNKYLNRTMFIDSIPLFIDGLEITGEQMPSAGSDDVKDTFRAVKCLRKIIDGLVASVTLSLKKYLDRIPTDEDVKRSVGIVSPAIINPHFAEIDYAMEYGAMPVAGHYEDSKHIISEWKNELKALGNSKPRGKILTRNTDMAAEEGENF